MISPSKPCGIIEFYIRFDHVRLISISLFQGEDVFKKLDYSQ